MSVVFRLYAFCRGLYYYALVNNCRINIFDTLGILDKLFTWKKKMKKTETYTGQANVIFPFTGFTESAQQ